MKNHVFTGLLLFGLGAIFVLSGCSELPNESDNFLSDEVIPLENAILKDEVVEPKDVDESADVGDAVESNEMEKVQVPEDLPYPETAERINVGGEGNSFVVSFYLPGENTEDFCSVQAGLLKDKGWIEVSKEDEKNVIMFEKDQSALTLKCIVDNGSKLITLVKTNISNNEEESGQ